MPPPWCRETLAPVIPPIVDGKPTYLVVYLHWKDSSLGHYPNVTASIKIPWVEAEGMWTGHQPGPGFSLGGKVEETEGANEFTLYLQLWLDDSLDEEADWPETLMGPGFPWRSNMVQIITIPGIDEQKMRVFA